jgi:hypothetical protein
MARFAHIRLQWALRFAVAFSFAATSHCTTDLLTVTSHYVETQPVEQLYDRRPCSATDDLQVTSHCCQAQPVEQLRARRPRSARPHDLSLRERTMSAAIHRSRWRPRIAADRSQRRVARHCVGIPHRTSYLDSIIRERSTCRPLLACAGRPCDNCPHNVAPCRYVSAPARRGARYCDNSAVPDAYNSC